MTIELLKAIAATAELTGTSLSVEAVNMMLDDLQGYGEQNVLKSLSRCRKEVRGRLTLADIISRIDDGRPGMEKAWAMLPKEESSSCLWTDEMRVAFGAASPLINDGDMIGARMAFKEEYDKQTTAARDEKRPVKWTVSFGFDVQHREDVLLDGVDKKMITAQQAAKMLPNSERLAYMADGINPLLENQNKIKNLLSGLVVEKKEPLPWDEDYDESQLLTGKEIDSGNQPE
jgi:hypothetical protein